MPASTYVMFGTDVVSCIYADQWNQSSQVDGPISGFVDAKQGAGDILATFRPGSRLLTWQNIAAQLGESEQPTIVYPKHHEQALLKQLEPLPSALRSQLNALALPEPPDYVIEWQRFNGGFEEAARLTEGYDSTLPTEHLIQSTLELSSRNTHQLTTAQHRQVQLLEAIFKEVRHPLRVIDFGGAAGANFHVLPPELKSGIESWTVLETPKVVEQARRAFSEFDQLRFETDIENINKNPHYVLASNSLQYIPELQDHFRKLSVLDATFFCVDRTPISSDQEERTYLQRVHRQDGRYSYQTSYPLKCRRLDSYLELLKPAYDIVRCETLNDEKLMMKGRTEPYVFVLAKRKQAPRRETM